MVRKRLKLYYCDTNILLSFALESENNHAKAKQVLTDLQQSYIYISPLTLIELYTSICRRIKSGNIRFVKELQKRIDLIPGLEEKCHYAFSLIRSYIALSLNIKIIEELNDVVEEEFLGGKVSILKQYKFVLDRVPRITLKTLDLFHIFYAYELAKRGKVKYFITLDKEIKGYANEIRNELQLEVIP